MKKILMILAVVFTAQFGFSQETTFQQDVKKFFELTGSAAGMEAIQEQVLPMVEESKQEDFKKEFSALLEDFYKKTTEVFQEEFTHDDIKSLVSIIEKGQSESPEDLGELIQASEVGKKFVEKEQVLDQKMQSKLATWGLELQMMMDKYGIE